MGKKEQKWYREMLLHPKWFFLRTKIWERENHSSEQEVLVSTLEGFQSNKYMVIESSFDPVIIRTH